MSFGSKVLVIILVDLLELTIICIQFLAHAFGHVDFTGDPTIVNVVASSLDKKNIWEHLAYIYMITSSLVKKKFYQMFINHHFQNEVYMN